MEEARWLSSFWGESENNRRAKFYRRTKAGERQRGEGVQFIELAIECLAPGTLASPRDKINWHHWKLL
jgi:DNA-binding PadR family transcriptional regulator